MPTTLIFGGSGKVARQLTRILTSQVKPPHAVHSIIRSAAHSDDLKALGATPILQSIEDSTVDQFAAIIRDVQPDFVVWSAGAGGGNPERTQKVDKEGAIKSMDALAHAGTASKRFILVSAVDVRDLSKGDPSWYKSEDLERSKKMRGILGPYMDAKLAADHDLVTNNAKRGLQYTIVRPGGLSEDPGTGKVAAGKVGVSRQISREDVGRVVAACMANDKTVGLAFDVIGGEIPVEQAVEEVAAKRDDCFEGLH